jgi:hypothetical protein
MSASGPTPPTFAVQQVVGYLGYRAYLVGLLSTRVWPILSGPFAVGDSQMKPMTLFSAFLVAALVDAQLAASKTAEAIKGSLSQTGQAMYYCQTLYAGARGALGRDRYAYIERCFKDLTGMYPAQAHENCTLRRC